MPEYEKLIAELREQVARIIDPEAWSASHPLMDTSPLRLDAWKQSSLAKAQAIHALYATALEGVMGERDQARASWDALQALVNMARVNGGEPLLDRCLTAEARAERAEAALKPFAEAAEQAIISGYSPARFVGAVEFEAALAVISVREEGEKGTSSASLPAHGADAPATDTQSSAGLDRPRSADRKHVPHLEPWAVNQRPKTRDHREPRLYRYENTSLYQWFSKVGTSVFEDAFAEPFVIAALDPDQVQS